MYAKKAEIVDNKRNSSRKGNFIGITWNNIKASKIISTKFWKSGLILEKLLAKIILFGKYLSLPSFNVLQLIILQVILWKIFKNILPS